MFNQTFFLLRILSFCEMEGYRMSAFGILKLSAKGLVIFIFTDTQSFSSGEKYIVTAVSINVAGIDQIGFINAYKLTVF